jgi:CheY-like chemotaxis protein
MSQELENLKVLVVDDKPYMRTLVRAILSGFELRRIEEANDGAEGFDEFRHFRPDIVITDWNMQPADGDRFVRSIRTDKTSPNRYVPIIVMTGHTEPDRIAQIRDCGVTEILAKPFSGQLLHERLLSALSKPRAFIQSGDYVGPDRRRRSVRDQVTDDRRRQDRTLVVASQLEYEENATAEIHQLDSDFADMKQRGEFDLPLLLDRVQCLEGRGHSFNYPLITDYAGSLYHFLGNCDGLDKDGIEVVETHLTALAVLASNRMSGQGNQTARELGRCLRELVGQSLA